MKRIQSRTHKLGIHLLKKNFFFHALTIYIIDDGVKKLPYHCEDMF